MSFMPKLQTALTVVFIVTTAGAISVAAQTPAAVDSSSTKPFADVVSTNKPNKKAPTALSEDTALDKTSAASRDENSVEVAGAPSVTTNVTNKTATLSKTPVKSVASSVTRSPQAADDNKWHFQASPYFWLASLHGTGGVGSRTTEVDMSFGDVFGALKFAIMGVFEARKDKLIFLTDIEYVHVEDDKATPGPFFSNVTAEFKTFIFDQEVGYRFYDEPDKGASVDVLGGVRVWNVSTELDFGAGILPAQRVEGSRTWVDGVVGLRGKAAVSEKMFVTGKFDLGGGGSNFTWQLFGGGGYNVNEKVALIGGYRVLDVNYNKDNFIYDMNQRGPIFGLGIKF